MHLEADVVPTYLAAAILAGCGVFTPQPTTTDTGGGGGGGTTIQDIQQGVVATDSSVSLDGVIVTSPVTAKGEGFFVQQPGGGRYSGIYVYLPGADELFLSPGDEVSVSGTVTEFYDWTELSAASLAAVEITGSGQVTVDDVDPQDVSDWEPWESCLVDIGAAQVAEGIDSYGEALLDDGLKLDNLFFDFETEAGATYTHVVGPVSYSFDEWRISPRSADDLQGYVAGEGPAPVTVHDVQTGSATGQVKLEGVVATTGPTSRDDGFFVSDPGGGEYSGVYVYTGGGGVPDGVVRGATLDITGTVEEFDSVDNDGSPMTEIVPGEITVTGTGTVPDPVVLSEEPADWEPYEGVLVQASLTIVDPDVGYGNATTDWDSVEIDDLFFDYTVDAGATYTITGPVEDYFGYKIAPRDQDDVVAGR